MTYREAAPAPSLRTIVAAYWALDSQGPVAGVRRILPDGCADLICDLAADPPTMRWVGTMTRAIEVPAGGGHRLFAIRFATGGLSRLLGAPMSLVTDRALPVAALPARHWHPPLAGWWGDADFAARCARADASLLAALPGLPGAGLTRLLHALRASPVLPSAAALAAMAGMGSRSLQRHFLDQVGVGPKQHLCYLRFERARHLLARPGWRAAEVAAAAGYSDQAHLIREFRRFAGVTPGRLG